MRTKLMYLEKIVSSIKMRFDVDPVIENNTIRIDAGNLSISELKQLEKYCEAHKYTLEVVKSVTFKISLS